MILGQLNIGEHKAKCRALDVKMQNAKWSQVLSAFVLMH